MLLKRILVGIVILFLVGVAGYSGFWVGGLLNGDSQQEAGGRTMGTTWSARYILDEGSSATTPEHVQLAIEQALLDVNQSMSTYIPNSELMQLNKASLNIPVPVSEELFYVAEQAQYVAQLSDGAYDPTIGALVNLWGFGSVDSRAQQNVTEAEPNLSVDPDLLNSELVKPESQAAFLKWMEQGGVTSAPTAEQIDRAKAQMGYQSLQLDAKNRTITKTKPVFIDLSSIAKGYGVDKVARTLEGLGISRYMVEVGGEIFTRGKKLNGQLWRLAVREPVLENQINTIVAIDNRAIATSGDYLNYYEVDGVHFSHLIDGRTGYPEQHRLASVAVIADETSLADAYATMFMILGDEDGIKLAQEQGIDAWFIYHTGEGFAAHATGQFERYRLELIDKDK